MGKISSRGKIVLITGGGRSGKSSFAQRLLEGLPGPRLYLATAVPFDRELEERVAKHRESRREGSWSTIEVPVEVGGAIRAARDFPLILVDCLTVWVNNLMWTPEDHASMPVEPDLAPLPAESSAPNGSEREGAPTEDEIAEKCRAMIAACREHPGTVVFVTNEVGFGIVPDNPAARLYRDLLGRCNQVVADAADSVILMIAGLPMTLKGDGALPARGAPVHGPSADGDSAHGAPANWGAPAHDAPMGGASTGGAQASDPGDS